MTMSCDDAGTSGVQRFEVFTGAGKRRDWSPEVKVSIVAESYSGQESVSAVARRHGMIPSQLFTWRRELRKQMEAHGFMLPVAPAPASLFVPPALLPEHAARTIRSRGFVDGIDVRFALSVAVWKTMDSP